MKKTKTVVKTSASQLTKLRVTLTTKPEDGVCVGNTVLLKKQPDNAFDSEAIQVFNLGEPKGYVSAFYKTRKLGTVSAGRLYDRMGDQVEALVVEENVAEVMV